MTNGDKIRQMPAEERAKYLSEIHRCPFYEFENDCNKQDSAHCIEGLLDWLESEVKE